VATKKQAYIYYVAKVVSSYHLYRAVKVDNSWESKYHKKVDTDSDLLSTTQLSATAITGKNFNYVVFTNDSGNIETVQDHWLDVKT
jgi:hypothetical protein